MPCKAAVYAANTTSTSIVSGGTLPLGATPVRRYNQCAVDVAGNAITLKECGYYLVTVSATFTAPAAGVVTLTLLDDSVAVPGATASTTITTATTEVRNISFTALVRVFNNSAPDNLTVLNSGVAATFSNIAVTAVKVV